MRLASSSVIEAGVSMLPEGIGYMYLETEFLFSQIFLSLYEGCVSLSGGMSALMFRRETSPET